MAEEYPIRRELETKLKLRWVDTDDYMATQRAVIQVEPAGAELELPRGKRGAKGDPGPAMQFQGIISNISQLPQNLKETDSGKAWVNTATRDLIIWNSNSWFTVPDFAGVHASFKTISAWIEEAERLKGEPGRDELWRQFTERVGALDGVSEEFGEFVESQRGLIQDSLDSLNDAYASSTAGTLLPPYLTQSALSQSYGHYVSNEAELDFALLNYKQINFSPGAHFTITSRKTIPEDTVINANESSISAVSIPDFAIEASSGVRISGGLTVKVSGETNSRGVLINGDNISVDSIKVHSATPGTGTVSGYAAGVAVSGNNISIGSVFVQNFDYAVNLISYIDGESSSNVRIDNLNVENYVRGVWIRDTKGVRIGSGMLSGKSPNSALLPGHNGFLMESRFDDATSDVHVTSVTVKDAGEHGFRLGGQSNISNVWFTNCLAKSTGGCGFKVLGGIEASRRHYNINYISCVVEDIGVLTQNQSAFLIERVSGGTLSNCIVRKVNQDRSCFTGIRINNCQNVVISNPNISDTNAHGIDISGYSGSCERVTVNGGIVRGPGNCGINIDFYRTTFRRVTVTSKPVLEVSTSNPAVRISSTGGGGAAVGGQFIEFSSSGTSVPVSDPTKSYIFDIFSDTFTDVDLVNGSTWRSRTDGVMRLKANNLWKTM